MPVYEIVCEEFFCNPLAGLFVSIGDSRYKLYSRDKDEYAETEIMVRPLFGFGFNVFPFPSKNSALYGLFAGATLSFMWSDNQWEKYGTDFSDGSQEVVLF